MEFIFADIFFGTIGWIFLFFKYRDIKKMRTSRGTEYDGLFSLAGRTIALQVFFILLGLGLLVSLVGGIIATIKNQ